MTKEKHIIVDEETHQMAKDQAKQAGMTIQGYVKSCFNSCKSDKKAK